MWTNLLLPALLLLASPTAADDGGAIDALARGLARPPPNATPFVELRRSALLDEPLVVRGTLRQPDADTLIREVESPRFERSTIRGDGVLVERGEGRPRRFALRRAPELAALLGSFRSLLGGDGAALRRQFEVQLDGSDQSAWRLRLAPIGKRRARGVRSIALLGSATELACVVLTLADGAESRMLLESAARDFDAGDAEAAFTRACSLAAP